MHIMRPIVYRCSVNLPLKCLIELAWPNYIVYSGIVSISELKSLQYYLTTVLTITALMMKMDPKSQSTTNQWCVRTDNYLLKPMSLDQSYNFMQMEDVSLWKIKISFGYQKSLRSSSSID